MGPKQSFSKDIEWNHRQLCADFLNQNQQKYIFHATTLPFLFCSLLNKKHYWDIARKIHSLPKTFQQFFGIHLSVSIQGAKFDYSEFLYSVLNKKNIWRIYNSLTTITMRFAWRNIGSWALHREHVTSRRKLL